jgi:predicted nucleic acid-binding protein
MIIINLSLESDFKDFEDAIQYHTAIENEVNIIITRNLKDFKTAKIPVLTAKDYIEMRK